ncbi:MAG TPA: YfhO family protein [Solirubrobacteraceae bacterium]|nr:YfhO family protein [Solirubrobacteraceae bacterium]
MQSAGTQAAVPSSRGLRTASPRGALAGLRRRPVLAAALVYALLSLVMVGQGLLPGRTLSSSDGLLSSVPWQSSKPASVPGLGTNFELADASNVFQPMFRYTRSQLPSIPLWNPFLGAGRPLLADGQSAVFGPFTVPSYVLPFWKSLAVAAMLKLFVGALGMFLLARALGMRFGGALLSGVVFAFGTFFVVWLAWPLTSVYAFIPWTLLLCERLVRGPSRLNVSGLGVVLALQFLAGHPESSFHLLFTASLYVAFRLIEGMVRRRSGWRGLLRPALAYVGALILGVGLAALVLLPFAEFVLHSGDLARRTGSSAGFWPRKYLGALFLHDYWGRPTQLDLESFMQVRGWYAGAVTLMLAAAALIRRRSALRVALVVYALFCVCMVIGLPPVFHLVSSLPGFSAAHNERLLIYVLVVLALLAGFGLDDLSGRVALPRPGRQAVTAAAAIITLIPVGWLLAAHTLSLAHLGGGLRVAWGFAHPPVPPVGVNVEGSAAAAIVRDSALEIWLPLAAIGFALIALRLRTRRPLPAGVFVAGCVILLAADLFRANMGFNPAIPIRTATPPVTGAIRYLQSRRPNRFIGVSTLQLSQPLPPDLAMTFRLYDARGYDFPVEKHFDALWRGYVAPGVGDFTQPEEFASATPAALRALDLLSVSDLMIGPLQYIRYPLHGPGLSVAYKGPDAVVYRNANALPRVFMVDHQQTVPGDAAALRAVTAPGFDGRGVAVDESPLAGLPQAVHAPAPSGASARLTGYSGQRAVIRAHATRRSLLVLTDSWYPGWSATVDGRAVPIHRVDSVLRGVALGAGEHTVVFAYAPASWTAGLIITGLCLLGVLGAVGTGVAARRRGRSAPAPVAPGAAAVPA